MKEKPLRWTKQKHVMEVEVGVGVGLLEVVDSG